MKNGLSEKEYKETEKFFQDNGFFFLKFDDLYDNSKADFKILIGQKSVLICFSLLISFVGLISFLILILYKDKKITDIYSVVGMNTGEYFMINAFYTLLLICFSLLIFVGFMVVLGFIDYKQFINSYYC